MIDNTILQLVIAALGGIVLGVIYFGGLWLTINRLRDSQHLSLLLGGSFLLRMTLVMGGFYLVSDGNLGRLALCLATFLLTRFVFIRSVQTTPERSSKEHGNQP
jgi:F1F0 ATPase subunit 2